MGDASASIAINDGGAALTQSHSSAILVGDGLQPIVKAIDVARKVDRTLRANMVIAAGYNTVGIALAAMGFLHPVASVLIMVVSSLVVTLRAIQRMETLSVK